MGWGETRNWTETLAAQVPPLLARGSERCPVCCFGGGKGNSFPNPSVYMEQTVAIGLVAKFENQKLKSAKSNADFDDCLTAKLYVSNPRLFMDLKLLCEEVAMRL